MTTPLEARPVPDIVTELPGPGARAHIEFDHAWTSPSLPRAYPIVPVRGLGCAVEDIDGNVFLDFAAGIAVNSTGHSHPDVVAAIQRQAAELQHFSASDFYLPIYAEAAAELARIAPMAPARVFIGNSGAEAVEAGLKLARYATKRSNVVAFLGGFHGRTMGAVSLTASKAKYHAHFGPLLPGVYHVPFGNEGLEELERRVFKRLMPADEFAAVIVEPIQGEGGYVVPEDDFLARLRELCDRHGILLIADEVQSGAGRTGKMWAVQHWDIEPDILLTAKGIGSGMPVGAMIARSDLMTWGPGAHGSTYGGNPVSLAALLETVRLLENGLIANAAIRGREIQDALRPLLQRHPALVKDVRGKGLMIGIQFDSGETAEAVQMQSFERGLLVLEAGDDCVRMSPPLVVSQAEAATAVRIFAEAVDHVATHRAADRVIVVVEELVDEAVIRADPNRTIIPGLIVDAVVVDPFGAHPSYVQGAYDRDNRFYLDWDPISRDEDALQAWLREWVYDLDDRRAYVEKLGAQRVASLKPGSAPSGSVDYGSYG